MSQAARPVYPMDEKVRRRAMSLAIVQGFLSMIGTWMVGGWFLNFFAMELGATGLMMGIVLAVANIVGLLRIFASYFVNRCDDRKRVWLVTLVVSRLVSIGFPLLAFPALRPMGVDPLWILVLLLCITTTANAIADVAWLSWFADIVPENTWGRYFARRNIWMAVPIMFTTLAGGAAVDAYMRAHPEAKLTGYAVIYSVGILFNALSLVPLLFVPNLKLRAAPPSGEAWKQILAPLRDVNFRRYAYFHCWLMLGSGIPQASFQLYLKNHLGVGLTVVGAFQFVNHLFNMAGQRWAGRVSDRFGNKPLIVLGLLGAASGPFFWLPTERGQYAPIFLAYVVWGLGWACVNLGSQNLMLKVAPQENNVAYIAAAQGLGGACLAICQILGGWFLDRLLAAGFTWGVAGLSLNAYHLFFLLSFLGRSSAALWVFGIREPGARSLPRMLRLLKRARRRRAHARARRADPAASSGEPGAEDLKGTPPGRPEHDP